MVLCKADKVLKEIEVLAETHYYPIVGSKKGQVLVDTIRKNKPKYVLEIGTNIGYSAILMGRELESKDIIITIEVSPRNAEKAKENIESASLKPAVEVLVGNALQILPKLECKFDLVFIDARKEQYLDYLKLIEDKIHESSVIVADNAGMFAYEMRDYLDYVRNSGGYNSQFVPIKGDGLEISIKV